MACSSLLWRASCNVLIHTVTIAIGKRTFRHSFCFLLDVPRCRCYGQHCVVMQNAPPHHLHPPLALPPRSHPACRPFWSPPPARTQPVKLNQINPSWGHARWHAHQLLRPHVVQDSLGSLAVMATLHNGKKELGGVILRKKHKRITFLNDL